MKRKMSEKHQAAAYILSKELNYPMKEIGTLMKVAQSTISTAVKDFTAKMDIRNLENELNEVREQLKKEIDFKSQPLLPGKEG